MGGWAQSWWHVWTLASDGFEPGTRTKPATACLSFRQHATANYRVLASHHDLTGASERGRWHTGRDPHDENTVSKSLMNFKVIIVLYSSITLLFTFIYKFSQFSSVQYLCFFHWTLYLEGQHPRVASSLLMLTGLLRTLFNEAVSWGPVRGLFPH